MRFIKKLQCAKNDNMTKSLESGKVPHCDAQGHEQSNFFEDAFEKALSFILRK